MEALTLSALGALGILYFAKVQESRKKTPVNHQVGFGRPPAALTVPGLTGIDHPELTIRIIVPSGSSGTDFDAQIYQTIFRSAVVVYVDQESVGSLPRGGVMSQYFDVNFYVERVLGFGLFPARWSWLMVNQEMLRVRSEPVEKMDLLICKTRYAERLLKSYFGGVPRVIYTAHTSRDLGSKDGSGGDKNYQLAVHLAGKSWLKGTRRLIKAWIRTDPPARLVVTCREFCLDCLKLRELLTYEFKVDRRGDEVYMGKRCSVVVSKFLSNDQLNELQQSAGVWMCPSEVEGYGHYCNESRGAGAVAVIASFPPLNEMVSEKEGFLVKVDEKTRVVREGQLPGSQRIFLKTRDISDAIRRVYATPVSELRKMGKRARKRYEADQRFLSESARKILDEFSKQS